MGFNSINFNINNIANKKAGLVQNQTQNANKEIQPQIQQQAQTPSAQINPALLYDIQCAKMDNETVLKYLQNLLKLPNSIDKFVSQLNSKNIDPKIASILIENMISTKKLSEFLNQNSTEAISKLMQTISSTLKSGVNDVSQLKEIMAILGAIQNSSSLNTNTIKELLLLYIPLNNPVFDKNIDASALEEEKEEASKNAKISILFETINFSNMLANINESQNNFLIDIFSSSDFPKEKFKTIVEALSKEANIVSLVEFKNKKQDNEIHKIQNFKILSDGYISPNALILSHVIIKTILRLDEGFLD